jgi:protein-S-isoprenylcysteine O-methyltransferase Ste14
MKGIFSVAMLALFILLVVGRALMLRKRGIRALVFGETDKSDFLLIPVVVAFFYTLCAGAFGFPVPRVLIRPFWVFPAAEWLGLLLSAVALVGFALTLKSFGDSFRVGIDEVKPDSLVTKGMFADSRNPIYVCFLLFFIGMFLTNPNLALAVFVPLLALAIHRQILREEAFLAQHYGDAYAEYRRRVRRYL